jgi:hypothetical protein
MESALRRCQQCNEPINLNAGRRDRIFCDAGCKNKYHNIQLYNEQQEIKRIQLVLKKNRRTLKKFFARNDRDQIPRESLLKEGFEFDYHTHQVTSKIKGNQFIFCFDYGYCQRENNTYKVVKAFD